MPKWTFEPGHTAAAFRARHMMVTWVRGSFKERARDARFRPGRPEAVVGEDGHRCDGHLDGRPGAGRAPEGSGDSSTSSPHPKITFEGDRVEIIGDHDFLVRGDLTIRGVTHEVPLRVSYLGSWPTPWWEEVDGE